MSRLRILTLTTLYPNAVTPSHGIFVENRLRHFRERHGAEIKVIAPVPYFPFKHRIFGAYANFAKVPDTETRHGIEITHPRYALIPKIGMTLAAHTLAHCFEKQIEKLHNDGWSFDLIDAHYYYPDGVAAAKIADKYNMPLTITARGTDINLIPQYKRQREMILEASAIAKSSITVCKALKDEMVQLGAAEEKIHTFRNGVDLEQFHPRDGSAVREKYALQNKVILSVGHLIERKGHDQVIRALANLEGTDLFIIGDGPEENNLRALATQLGLSNRVHFVGHISHENLAEYYSVADCLVLASSREGWPNVLLEAMACGTPCVATPVWGTKEVIRAPAAGLISSDRSVGSLAASIAQLLNNPPSRVETRTYAELFSWNETSDNLQSLFSAIVTEHRQTPSHKDWSISRTYQEIGDRPRLLITVDTEEVFDWHKKSIEKHGIAPIEDIAKFQLICQQAGFRPLYFLTWPLLNDPETVAYFNQLNKEGTANLGIHMHQWVTPPEAGAAEGPSTYQCNLEPALHEQKLRALIEKFETAFGFKPISHRAGRYGVSPMVHAHLEANHIKADFSPSACYDHSTDGGPDFSGVTNTAWYKTTQAEKSSFLCMPVTGARAIKKTNWLLPQKAGVTFKPLPRWQSQISAPVRLTPEGNNLKMLQSVTRHLSRKEPQNVMTFSLHSTSLTIGATPYSQTDEDVEKLLNTTEAYLNWFSSEIGTPISLEEILARTND